MKTKTKQVAVVTQRVALGSGREDVIWKHYMVIGSKKMLLGTSYSDGNRREKRKQYAKMAGLLNALIKV